MPKTIRQTVTLPAPADMLFEMYLNPKMHAAFTGAPVIISAKPGSKFRAFGDMLSGQMLHVVPKRMIVQSWRANHWKAGDINSILILTFCPKGKSGRIELVHVNVADHDYAAVKAGWNKYYWIPWRRYLKGR